MSSSVASRLCSGRHRWSRTQRHRGRSPPSARPWRMSTSARATPQSSSAHPMGARPPRQSSARTRLEPATHPQLVGAACIQARTQLRLHSFLADARGIVDSLAGGSSLISRSAKQNCTRSGADSARASASYAARHVRWRRTCKRAASWRSTTRSCVPRGTRR